MSKEIKPLSPKDIDENLKDIIPSVVIQAVNNMLKKEYRGGSSVVILQRDIIAEIMSLDNSYTTDYIFKNKFLDFEDLYRKNGWDVEYDKPGYNENYEASFKFKKK